MAPEPINVFSHKVDPAGIVTLMNELADDVAVDGPGPQWETLIATGDAKQMPNGHRLVISHDPDYYTGDNWPIQMRGMRNYFSGFSDVPLKPEILKAIGTFRFVLAFPDADVDIDGDDPRREWILAICRHLDGVIFTPSSLRDATGRVMIGAGGEYDADAVLCSIPEIPIVEHDDDDEDVEEETFDPPTPERVMRRAMVLSAIGNRGLIENEAEEMEDADDARQRMLDWIEQTGLSDELEPEEWKVLQRPVGTLVPQSAINATWRLEGLGVLLWALGKCDLPSHDELVNPGDLFEAACIFDSDEAREAIAGAKLRSAHELDEFRTFATMLHWRLREFSLRPQKMDFIEFSKDCWWGSFDISPFEIADNDLALGGETISEADPDLFGLCQSIAVERHHAANWLAGDRAIYSEVDTST